MTVISQGLFLIMKRYPSRKDTLRRMYQCNPSFQALCDDFQKCSHAMEYWARSGHAFAAERSRDYRELLRGLESEIEELIGPSGQ